MAKRKLPSTNPDPVPPGNKFDPKILDRTTIAIPLLEKIRGENEKVAKLRKSGAEPEAKLLYDVVIDLNLDYEGGRTEAKEAVAKLIAAATRNATRSSAGRKEGVHEGKTRLAPQYVFASLSGDTILEIAQKDLATARQSPTAKSAGSRKRAADPVDTPQVPQTSRGASHKRAIYRIWPDFPLQRLTNMSISTVKADAAHRSFNALGSDIIWAVIDSGVDEHHPHFKKYGTLTNLPPPVDHMDFSNAAGVPAKGKGKKNSALEDGLGHGTHVAGIIAGEGDPKHLRAVMRRREDSGDTVYDPVPITTISGMAPKCKILSLRVLDDEGRGNVSNIIAAIAQIQEWNAYGRRILVHGVNLSVGYGFNAEWFACGQSPLCLEVDRLVKSGVVVVVAAGNTGYGTIMSDDRDEVKAGLGLTINDPGNADYAITVGSTHRDMPHIYGVSYFSSKGPTGDGRTKPDLVAPGEKILSCAAGTERDKAKGSLTQPGMKEIDYVELSGTSMAAPHVSGVVAAFLSVRKEFIGRPEVVKSILLSNATDLKRERYFQGHGLVDLMRAIQSV